VWTQQGSKLVGTGAVVNGADQGSSVALSADGNTALVGGPFDDSALGAVWVFTRSNGVWTQQGPKLVGSGAEGIDIFEGSSVALSADGNTALVAANSDNFGIGAMWVFTRSGGVWTQKGRKFFGSGATGPAPALQGNAVALSADASTILEGGPQDNNFVGAAWVFVPAPPAPPPAGCTLASQLGDAGGDGHSDILWRNNNGAVTLWQMAGQNAQADGLGTVGTDWNIAGFGDLDGDGKADIVWRNVNGAVAVWFMNGAQVKQAAGIDILGTDWHIAGVRDFDGDGRADILFRNDDGSVGIWFMIGAQIKRPAGIGLVGIDWRIVGVGDFDGDKVGDILWRNNNGAVAIWFMSNTAVKLVAGIGSVGTDWTIAGVGDFDADKKSDIVWRNQNGAVALWFMNATQVKLAVGIGSVGADWAIIGIGDMDGTGTADIVWRNQNGAVSFWFMNGAQVASAVGFGSVGTDWQSCQQEPGGPFSAVSNR